MTIPTFNPSLRMQRVQEPIIPEIATLIQNNPGTISLGQGVVYYSPPAAALQRARDFKDNHENHIYSEVTGIPALRTAIERKLAEDNAVSSMHKRRLVVTAGSNMAFVNALAAIADPDDEIILFTPFYFNHEMAITMFNCRPVTVACDSDFQPKLDELEKAISKRTRAIVTVSPNNPTGAVYPEETLRKINGICRENGLFHISDEAYEYFTYADVNHFSPASIADSEEHTIALYSLSKAYGFASWRIGYMLIPEQLFVPITKVQDSNLICPGRISQEAAIAALETGKPYCLERLQTIKQVRNNLIAQLQTLGSVCEFPVTGGAFYFLLKLRTELTGLKVVQRLISEFNVAVIPGEAFGLTNGCFLRVAYGALDIETSNTAIERLITGLKTIIK